MAKPSKPSKKPSKIGNFLSKLNPNTPKKKLLTFVLVFALAGGGYYAYRSFAATNTIVYAPDKLIASDTHKITEYTGSKRGQKVVVVPPTFSVSTPNTIIWARNVRTCASVRGIWPPAGPNISIGIWKGDKKLWGYANGKTLQGTSNYQYVCSSWVTHDDPAAPVHGTVKSDIGQVHVAFIAIEIQ